MTPNFENPQKKEEFPEMKGQVIDYINKASIRQLIDAEEIIGIRLEPPKDSTTESFRLGLIEAINDIKNFKEAEDIFYKLMPDQEMKKEQE